MNAITFDQYLQELSGNVGTDVFAQEQNTLERVAKQLGGTLEQCVLTHHEVRLGQYQELLGAVCQPLDVGGSNMLYAWNGFGVLVNDGWAMGGPTAALVWNSEQYSEEDLLVGPYE